MRRLHSLEEASLGQSIESKSREVKASLLSSCNVTLLSPRPCSRVRSLSSSVGNVRVQATATGAAAAGGGVAPSSSAPRLSDVDPAELAGWMSRMPKANAPQQRPAAGVYLASLNSYQGQRREAEKAAGDLAFALYQR